MEFKLKNLSEIRFIIIIIAVLIVLTSLYVVQYKRFEDSGYSTSNSYYSDTYYLNPEENLKSAGAPGTFSLSANVSEVYTEEDFKLEWTASDGAKNYSVYSSDEAITVIDGGQELIEENITETKYVHSEDEADTFYYVVVAYNESGQTLSNWIKVLIEKELRICVDNYH